MDKEILKEELGISNDVKMLVSLVKNRIGDDFAKNYKNKKLYYGLNQEFPYKVFHGDVSIKWRNIDIHIIYYVMPDNDEYVIRNYLKRMLAKHPS